MNIAVIGGGLSGTLLTYYLLEEDTFPMTILLFEKDYQQLGRGIQWWKRIICSTVQDYKITSALQRIICLET